ncbi:hypothetical protein Q0Z83_060300 [Actinoplanes sichuanensis]|uniref:Terminase n=1 Tax=Actinoplanes sichuanensis TaxID=512349 RepID=A0ABW4A6L4_9ACTN|nr:hypothetical protein [Actinoplanes sichuanensis]BEL07839.1 hypothetical protein Q0Z83_060300 [Actinoplanes sichuanensis]
MSEPIAPAHLWVPPSAGSYGDEAVDLMRLAGRELDAEQVHDVTCMLAYRPGGRWAAFEEVIIEPRQNGKSGGVLMSVVVFDLFLLKPDRIVWTAHLFKTAREAFMDLKNLIDATPELSKRVKAIREGKGDEAIELHGKSRTSQGALLEFLARSEGGGRGLGGKRLVFDEALFLGADSMGALIPTLAARSITGDPQIMYGSSAAVLRSDHLRVLRDRGRKGGDPSLVYIERCAPGSWDDPGCADGPECTHMVGVDGCALDDETLWLLANHALGKRISYEYIRNERRSMPTPEQFGRERLGWHTDPIGAGELPVEAWALCFDANSAPTTRPVFMIDASPGLKSVAIAAAMWRPDGLPHLELVAHSPGSTWVAERAAQLRQHRPLDWVLDPSGPAGALLPALREAGIEPTLMTPRDMGQACEAFAAAVENRALRHLDEPVLRKALAGAGRRDVGDGLWVWSRRKSDIDICPLVGATGAFWGLSVVPPETPPPPSPLVETLSGSNRAETDYLAGAGF